MVSDVAVARADVGVDAGPIPADLGNVTSLAKLWLHNNKLTGESQPVSPR